MPSRIMDGCQGFPLALFLGFCIVLYGGAIRPSRRVWTFDWNRGRIRKSSVQRGGEGDVHRIDRGRALMCCVGGVDRPVGSLVSRVHTL